MRKLQRTSYQVPDISTVHYGYISCAIDWLGDHAVCLRTRRRRCLDRYLISAFPVAD